MNKTGFFEEEPGVKSVMRLNCSVALWAGIALSIYSVVTKQLDGNMIGLISIYLTAAFAPKAVQKFAENKSKADV